MVGSVAAGTGTRLCEPTVEEAETLHGESLKTHENHFLGVFCPGHPGQNRPWSEGQVLGIVKVAQGLSKPGSARRRVRTSGLEMVLGLRRA